MSCFQTEKFLYIQHSIEGDSEKKWEQNKEHFLAAGFGTSSINNKVIKNAGQNLHSKLQIGQKMSGKQCIYFYPPAPHHNIQQEA